MLSARVAVLRMLRLISDNTNGAGMMNRLTVEAYTIIRDYMASAQYGIDAHQHQCCDDKGTLPAAL